MIDGPGITRSGREPQAGPAAPSGAPPVDACLIDHDRKHRVRRRKRVAAAIGLCGLLVLLGGGTYVAAKRNQTTPVSFDDALARFRREAAAGPGAVTGPADAAADPQPGGLTGAVAPAIGPGRIGPGPVSAGVTQGVAPGPSRPRPAGAGVATPFSTPAAGVYSYDTTGAETISIFGARHDYPPVTYATVRPGDGGTWRVDWLVLKEHVDHYGLQGVPGQALELFQGRDVTFFGQTDGATLTATPPQIMADVRATPGSATDAVMRGPDGSTAHNHVTFIGPEALNVGGTVVNALHLTVDSVVHGKAEGTEHDSYWIDGQTGLVLRLQRSLDTNAHAVFGNVHYVEHASFSLRSLTPST